VRTFTHHGAMLVRMNLLVVHMFHSILMDNMQSLRDGRKSLGRGRRHALRPFEGFFGRSSRIPRAMWVP